MIQRLLPESLSADKNKKAITKDGFLNSVYQCNIITVDLKESMLSHRHYRNIARSS
jgi:hypothetical protein